MRNTVLTFVFIEFDQNWSTWSAGIAFYNAVQNAQLIVVAESATGIKTTYWFNVSKGGQVIVSFSENLVYIPARCAKRARGDRTACGEKRA